MTDPTPLDLIVAARRLAPAPDRLAALVFVEAQATLDRLTDPDVTADTVRSIVGDTATDAVRLLAARVNARAQRLGERSDPASAPTPLDDR